MNVHDLRGRAENITLRYPVGSTIVVVGIPGAGKTTLLRRLFGLTGREDQPVPLPGGAQVIDSEQSRNRWRQRLGSRVPYALYRPLVHACHLLTVSRAVRAGRGVILHDCGTRRRLLRLVTGGQTHVVALDVAPETAWAGQQARGRKVRGSAFRKHARAWRFPEGDGLPGVLCGHLSVVLLDRDAASALQAIELGAAPASHGLELLPS
ncbi:AAA family ATPase [Longispora albida]|uniref:AAA family ATPase n=1 Tax=Longispora albida TaxID=203523 RepID=UPI0003744E86|nr:AAA family ATPase [Longispora albida]